MKLPRGTFHSIKKGLVFHLLLDELSNNGFTGYCLIRYGAETCTLVLNSGIYILADYNKLEGEPAWQKIQQLREFKVDAELSTLNTAQLQLTKEFNPHATLPGHVQQSIARQARAVLSNSDSGTREDIFGMVTPEAHFDRQKTLKPHPDKETVMGETHHVQQLSPRDTPESHPGQQPIEKGPEVTGSDIDRDLATLDEMDIDEMTKKIRKNCKITIENLDLDHLIEKKEEQE